MVDQSLAKDQENKQLANLGHSILLIADGTRTLKRCYDERSYKMIEKFKEIEEFLGNTKNMDYSSYLWFKKKYSNWYVFSITNL